MFVIDKISDRDGNTIDFRIVDHDRDTSLQQLYFFRDDFFADYLLRIGHSKIYFRADMRSEQVGKVSHVTHYIWKPFGRTPSRFRGARLPFLPVRHKKFQESLDLAIEALEVFGNFYSGKHEFIETKAVYGRAETQGMG